MMIERVLLGTWFPRTALHLDEIEAVLRPQERAVMLLLTSVKKTVPVTLPTALLRAADRIARAERRSRSAVVETALRQYERDRETLGQMQTAGRQAARTAGLRSMAAIDRLVHEVRRERRARRR